MRTLYLAINIDWPECDDLVDEILLEDVFENYIRKYGTTQVLINNQMQQVLDALKPLAEIDLTGVNSDILYQRNKTEIKVSDVIMARSIIKYFNEILPNT